MTRPHLPRGSSSCGVLLLAASGCAPGPPEAPAPNAVVLVVVDTLRADAVGAYGAEGDVSPTLDGLAAGGLLFERCLATSSWTWPSTASLLTGELPPEHGLIGKDGSSISPDVPSVAEAFRQAGWATGAFVANPIMDAELGFARGFDTWEGAEDSWDAAEVPLGGAARWLEQRPADEPFFLYVHLVEPHSPYRPSDASAEALGLAPPPGPEALGAVTLAYNRMIKGEPYDTEAIEAFVEWRRRCYAAEVRDADLAVAALLEDLETRGRLDRTLVAVTSDHGEEFLEHGLMGHGGQLFPESVHVPLILSGPGVPRGARAGERVENRMLGATLLRLAGLDRGAGLDPADLTDAEERALRQQDPTLLHLGNGGWIDGTDYLIPDEQLGLAADGEVTVRARFEDGDRAASHRAFDPGSAAAPAAPAAVERVTEEFDRLRRPADSVPMSEALEQKLRGLGYNLGREDR